MPKLFNCITCGTIFERSRPDQNSQVRCSIRCRWNSYVSVPADVTACWEWVGARARSGYGVLQANGKVVTAHRLSLLLHGVEIDGWSVLHSCDNRLCVNPLHLRVGTSKDNIQDCIEHRRHAWYRWTDEERRSWVEKMLQGQLTYRSRQNCA